MTYIYVISSRYLEAIAEESKKYSFTVYGHPSIENASKHLHDRNLQDYLGYIYMEDTLPKNLPSLVNLINLIDLAALKGQLFLISLHSNENINYINKHIHCKNLNVQLTPAYTTVTDIYIGKLFSLLLKNTRSIYKGFDILGNKRQEFIEPVESSLDYQHNSLIYTGLFPDTFLQIFSHVKVQNTLEDTVQIDLGLHKLKYLNSSAYNIRLLYIQAHFRPISEQLLLNALTKFSKDDLFINSSLYRFENLRKEDEVL